jgi:hypothetical protein
MIKKLDENDIYWISKKGKINECVMIHLVGGSVEGKDAVHSVGWYLFKGELGKMKPIKKLSTQMALKMVNATGRY